MFRAVLEPVLRADLEQESFARKILQALEMEFRKLALSALADWQATGIVSSELFQPVATLQRPSWGAWNGLLQGLGRARRSVLRQAAATERERVEQAKLLSGTLEALDTRIDDSLRETQASLASLTRSSLAARPTLGQLLALPIVLRNRVEHDRPTDPAWWNTAANPLRQMAEWLIDRDPFAPLEPLTTFPAPWFLHEAGTVWSFNGLNEDLSAIFVSDQGSTSHRASEGAAVVLACQQLLGKSDVIETDFRRLLGKFAPEEIRGVLLGDYLLGRKVGEGGFASVHVGRQFSTGRRVALKVLRDGLGVDATARLKQEAEFLSQLNHPHIVDVFGYAEEVWSAPRNFSLENEPWYEEWSHSAPRKCFIALEWIDGPNLEQVFQALHRPDSTAPGFVESVSQRQLTEWFQQAAEALAAVHAAGYLHRDLKPGNFMITAERALKVMDLGIARSQKEARSLITTAGRELGTPEYMSPEQLRATDPEAEVGPASDVYSLCATFYELFTGHRVFDHESTSAETVRDAKLKGSRPRAPRTHNRQLPWELDTIISIGLEAEPADRYASMAELAADIKHFLGHEPIEKRPPSLPRRMRLWYRRNPAVSTLVTTLAALLVAVAVGSTLAAFRLDKLRSKAVTAEGNATKSKNQAIADRDRARKRLEFATRQVSAYVSVLKRIPRQSMTLGAVTDLIALEKDLDATVEEYYQDIAGGKASDDPQLYRDYAIAVTSLNRLKYESGGISSSTEGAERALAMLREIEKQLPEDDEVETAILEIKLSLSETYHRVGRFGDAANLMGKQAADLASQDVDPLMPELAGWDQATSLVNLSMAQVGEADFDAAEASLDKAHELRRDIATRLTDEYTLGRNNVEHAGVLTNLAVVYRYQQRVEEALSVLTEAEGLLDEVSSELFSDDEMLEHYHHVRAGVLDNMAFMYVVAKNPEKSIEAAHAALREAEHLDPKVDRFRILRARCYRNLALAYMVQDDFSAMRTALDRCQELFEAFNGVESESFDVLADIGGIYQFRAMLEGQDGNYEEALEWLEKSEPFTAKAAAGAPHMIRQLAVTPQFVRPFLLANLGRYAEVQTLCDNLDVASEGASQWAILIDLLKLECEAAQGDYSLAVQQAMQYSVSQKVPISEQMMRIQALAALRARVDADPELTPRMREQRSKRYSNEVLRELKRRLESSDALSPDQVGALKFAYCFSLLRENEEFQSLIEQAEALLATKAGSTTEPVLSEPICP